MVKRKQVSVLWSGGFDSTFRMIELSQMKNIEVVPYYLEFDKSQRPSINEEKKALGVLYDFIVNRKQPSVFIHKPEIIPQFELTEEYRKANQELWDIFMMPLQWAYFGMFAEKHKGLEVCFQKFSEKRDDNISRMLFENNGMQIDSSGIGRIQSFARPSTYFIFKDLSFPIINRDNFTMLKLYKKWRYDKILSKIVFCRNNFNGKPCGFCNTCLQKLYARLYYFFDKEALRKYMVDAVMKQYLFSLIRNGKVKQEEYYTWRKFNRDSMRDLCLGKEPVVDNDLKQEYISVLKKYFVYDFKTLQNMTKFVFSR